MMQKNGKNSLEMLGTEIERGILNTLQLDLKKINKRVFSSKNIKKTTQTPPFAFKRIFMAYLKIEKKKKLKKEVLNDLPNHRRELPVL